MSLTKNPTNTDESTKPQTVAATPPNLPMDLPASAPNRGLFPPNLVLPNDRSDADRGFRTSNMRSAVFPFPPPSTPTAQPDNSIAQLEADTAAAQKAGQQASDAVANINMDTIANGQFYAKPAVTALNPQGSVDPSRTGVVMIGAVVPSLSAPFSYTCTTTTIVIINKGQSILRADGTVTPVPDATTTVTGLLAGKTYYFYPYWGEPLSPNPGLNFVVSSVAIPNLAGVLLNGSTGLVTSTTSISRLIGDAFSLEIWFKSVAASAGVLIELNANHTGAPSTTAAINGIAMESSGTIRGLVQHNAGGASPVPYNDGVWHQAVLTFAGGTGTAAILYVDGASANAGTATGTTQSGFWRIGNGGVEAASEFFNGTLAHASVWNFVLTAAQVANHFNTMLNSGPAAYIAAVLADGPLYYWELAESSGTAAADSSSGGTNTGLYTGGFTLNNVSPVIVGSGSPAIAWDSPSAPVASAQSLQNLTPLSVGSLAASTVATGTGGGVTSGSAIAACFSGNTRVEISGRGNVAIQDVQIGDKVLTARGTYRAVKALLKHDYSGMVAEMVTGQREFVTPTHRILVRDRWIGASEIFGPWTEFMGEVFNLSVESESDDNPNSALSEQSYQLANGYMAHNAKIFK